MHQRGRLFFEGKREKSLKAPPWPLTWDVSKIMYCRLCSTPRTFCGHESPTLRSTWAFQGSFTTQVRRGDWGPHRGLSEHPLPLRPTPPRSPPLPGPDFTVSPPFRSTGHAPCNLHKRQWFKTYPPWLYLMSLLFCPTATYVDKSAHGHTPSVWVA